MGARKSLLCSAALMLYLANLNFQPAEAQCGGFCASCINIAILPGAILQANCKTDSSGDVYATTAEMSLDQFIGNSNGVLVANDAGFLESCQRLSTLRLQGGDTVLNAFCQDDTGIQHWTLFHLNNNVVNVNGALGWNDC